VLITEYGRKYVITVRSKPPTPSRRYSKARLEPEMNRTQRCVERSERASAAKSLYGPQPARATKLNCIRNCRFPVERLQRKPACIDGSRLAVTGR